MPGPQTGEVRIDARRFAVAAAALATVAVTALVGSASASAGRTGLYGEVEVKASNGYHVSIGAHRWKHRRGKVSVVVRKGYAWSMYTAHGRVSRHRLKANLGDFGRIRLRYHPKERRQAPSMRAPAMSVPGSLVNGLFQRLLGCGVSIDDTGGRFKGRIRFHGEDGYTRVRANRARGFISPATTGCSKIGPVHGVALDARSDSLRFEADRFRGESGALLLASEREDAGRVAIRRIAIEGGRKSWFTFDPNLTSAHLEPTGSAFVGTADLSSSNEWTGTLAASFPGDPSVPLAGPEFIAGLGRF
jgi:hypothetical protein